MGSIPAIKIEHTSEYNLSTDRECSISLKPSRPDNIITDVILVFIVNGIMIVDHGFIFNYMDSDNNLEYVIQFKRVLYINFSGLCQLYTILFICSTSMYNRSYSNNFINIIYGIKNPIISNP